MPVASRGDGIARGGRGRGRRYFFGFGAGAGFFLLGGHGPRVSPWARCAGTAFWLTSSVTYGFLFDPVR